MEQEPVYVPSDRLDKVCERILGTIYDRRQTDKERYVTYRVQEHNAAVVRSNGIRKYGKWLGIKPKMLITPFGMELLIRDELEALPDEKRQVHPMVEIHRQYGQLEHEAKDCKIQCQLNESVPVSGDMARGISHLGLPLDFLVKPRFGFHPR